MSNWFPWNWGTSSDNPVKDLDPSLRDYLNKQQPDSSRGSQTQKNTPSYRQQVGIQAPDDVSNAERNLRQRPATDESKQTQIPRESLYQDGRYKQLWASYKPLEEIEEAAKTESNKLTDIVEGYRERQASISRAAMENCAMEELAVHECYRSGTWAQIMKMCRDENRALDRCVSLQSRFLRALGYSDVFARTSEETEKIQMHADQLYNRMLDYEKLVAEAKDQGREPPPLKPLFEGYRTPSPHQRTSEAPVMPRVGSVSWDKLEEERQARIEASKFVNMSPHEKELAKTELDTQFAIIEEVNKRINDNLWEDYQTRKNRQEKGVERPQDKIRRWFDFRPYPSERPIDAQRSVGDESQPKRS